MGYTGSAAGLLDAETNLKYATKYLAGAYLVGGSEDQAIRGFHSVAMRLRDEGATSELLKFMGYEI